MNISIQTKLCRDCERVEIAGSVEEGGLWIHNEQREMSNELRQLLL